MVLTDIEDLGDERCSHYVPPCVPLRALNAAPRNASAPRFFLRTLPEFVAHIVPEGL